MPPLFALMLACHPPLPEDTGFLPDSGADSGLPDSGDTGETGDTAADTAETADTGPVDADGDGVPASTDCDDADADVHPGATERLDGKDDDCDDATDEVEADGTVVGSGTAFGYNVLVFPSQDGTSHDVAVASYGSGDVHLIAADDVRAGGAAASLRRLVLESSAGSMLGVDMVVAPVGGDDTLADLVLGAPNLDGDGAVAMVRYTTLYDDRDLSLAADARMLTGEGGLFGKSFALVGGLVVVAAPGLDAGESGTTYIFDADTLAHPTTGALTEAGRIEGTFGSGFDVAALDWNADGEDDLVVSNPFAGEGARVLAGEVAIWVTLPTVGEVTSFDDADGVVTGATANLRLGGALVPAGDVDGSGYEEIVVGTAVVQDGSERGVAVVESDGRGGYRLLATLTGIQVDKTYTDAITVGDVTADGHADLVVGAFGATDQVLLYDATRLAAGGTFAPEDADAWIDSVSTDDDDFGIGLATLPRVDGAGVDLLVGAPFDGDGVLAFVPSEF